MERSEVQVREYKAEMHKSLDALRAVKEARAFSTDQKVICCFVLYPKCMDVLVCGYIGARVCA